MSKKCIISFANDRGNYLAGIKRLEESLAGNFDGDFLPFYGESYIGSPKHEDNPYAFKIYCWLEAIKLGYTHILWLDASCFVIKDLSPVFDEIEKTGYIMQEAGHMVGSWCNEFTLDWFGLTRERAMKMPMYGNAGFLGLDITRKPSASFFRIWKESMEAGCFKGSWEDHRHDMVCGSIIANETGMKYKKGDEWLQYAGPGTEPLNDTILIFAQGM